MSKSKKKNIKKKDNFDFFTNSNFTVFEVILFIFASVIFGMIAGCILTYSSSSLSLIRSDSNLSEIINTYKNLSNNYYGKVDNDKISNGAIKGMIESLDDPNSVFLADDTGDDFNEYIDGKYIGIGITAVLDGDHYIVSDVVKDGPADKEGILEGDTLISINDVDCFNLSNKEISYLIKNSADSTLKIVISRNDEIMTFNVTKQYIDLINVTDNIYRYKNKYIGYINISLFSSNTYDQFKNSYKNLNKEGIDSLIIDLRNNPGGHLVQAKKILELFFKKSTLLYQLKNSDSTTKVYSSTNKSTKIPVVILINDNTASAAETMTACFRDNYSKVTIVGTTSYGKGSVQKSMTLNSGKTIKYTIEEWLTPKGKSIDGKGIEPDIEVINDGDDDKQLIKAINILK